MPYAVFCVLWRNVRVTVPLASAILGDEVGRSINVAIAVAIDHT